MSLGRRRLRQSPAERKALFRRLHLQIGGANIENPLRFPTLAASGEISGKRNPAVTIRA